MPCGIEKTYAEFVKMEITKVVQERTRDKWEVFLK